ncbi:phenylacetate--CoA ligase family protein [Pseudomonadota bacterium]
MTKPIIRKNFDDLLTTEPGRRAELRQRGTSGSTGEPLIFREDLNFRDYYTAYVHHHLTWGGWKPGQPHAYIGGTSLEAGDKVSIRNGLMNWTWNRFSVNAYTFSDTGMSEFADKVRRKRPMLLYGYASSIYNLARFVRRSNFDDIRFKSVFCTAEVLYPHQRLVIRDAFKSNVFGLYASRELGDLACQCDAQTGFHASMENVFIEIIDDAGNPAKPGDPGRMIVTSLTNYGMPFIRYDLADIVAWRPDDPCPCGRAHPMLSVVEGRHNDMFETRDGRKIWGGLANPLWEFKEVLQFQMIQKSYELVLVRIVKEGDLHNEALSRVRNVIHTALDKNVEVRFEFPDRIPVEASGKHRFQICELNQ